MTFSATALCEVLFSAPELLLVLESDRFVSVPFHTSENPPLPTGWSLLKSIPETKNMPGSNPRFRTSVKLRRSRLFMNRL